MSSFRYREQKKRRQPGFTLIEMVVALAVAAIVLVSTIALGRYIVVATGDQSDQVLARLQVQYVSFWIGEDVVQANTVKIGNITEDRWHGDPISSEYILFLYRNTWPDDKTVEYYIYEDTKNNLWSLYRTVWEAGEPEATTVVAEYLDPLSTRLYQKQSADGAYVLELDVTAVVDQKQTSGTYEIHPRAGNVTWESGG